MATQSSILAWKNPMDRGAWQAAVHGVKRAGHNLATKPKKKERNRASSVQLLSRVWLFATLWTAAHQASLSITNSRSLLKPMSTESVMQSNHLILCHPLLLLPSILPSIRAFPMSQFASGSQRIGVSASTLVLPMNIQDWFALGWLVWSPCSPRDSQESSPTPQFESISSSSLSFLYGPPFTSIHGYWINHNFD